MKRSAWRYPVQVALLAVVYYAAARLGQLMAIPPGNVTPIWPASGIALAAVLLLGARIWPGIWLGSFLGNTWAFFDGSSLGSMAVSLLAGTGLGAGATLEALAGAVLLRVVSGERSPLGRVQDVLTFVTLAGVLSCMLSATIGTVSLCLGGFLPWTVFARTWFTWWTGDIAGVLLVTPLLLTWSQADRTSVSPKRTAEAALWLAALVAVSQGIFGLQGGGEAAYAQFAIYPIMIWAMLRFGQLGATTGIVLVSAIAAWGMVKGFGPFAGSTTYETTLLLQAFLATLALTMLLLTAVLTERAQAQATLMESERRFRAVAQSVNNAIVLADNTEEILLWNKGAEKMFGYREEEALGRPLTLLMPERYRTAHLAGVARLLSTGQSKIIGQTVELNGLRKDGREFPVELSLASWTADKRIFFSAIISDITDRKRAEQAVESHAQELIRSNAELEQFAYVASHDLQEPLRMISSYTQLLARRYKGRLDADADEFIAFAVDGATRMQELIRNLLEYSRVGTKGEKMRPTDCGNLLGRVLAGLRVAIEQNKATVTRGSLPTVMADDTQLSQVLQNLIGNAIKFHGQDPPNIHVAAELRGPEWVFSIRDNGIGFDPKHASRVFALFQRLHSRKEYPGTGIGLAICKKIVERHGGRIWAESMPGTGTTFFFTLPKMAEQPV